MKYLLSSVLPLVCVMPFLACTTEANNGVVSRAGAGGFPAGGVNGGTSGAIGGQGSQLLLPAGGTGDGIPGPTGGIGGVASSAAGGTVSAAAGGAVGGAVGSSGGAAPPQGGVVSALGGVAQGGGAGADNRSPAAVLGGLVGWHLTLPVGPSNSATSIQQRALETYSDQYFFVTGQPSRVRFVSIFGGARTSTGTAYARSELRQEYAGPGASQSWPCATSAHTMHLKGSIVLSPLNKPEMSIGQIHDAANDLLELLYKGPEDGNGIGTGNGTTDVGRMEASLNNGTTHQVLDAAYRIGDIMMIDVTTDGAGNMGIQYLNQRTGAVKQLTEPFYGGVSGGCYFKAGNYHQACTKIDVNGATNASCVGKGWVAGRYETDPLGQSMLDIFELTAN